MLSASCGRRSLISHSRFIDRKTWESNNKLLSVIMPKIVDLCIPLSSVCNHCSPVCMLYAVCMYPLAFLFLSPSTVAQLSLTYSKDSTVIIRCSTIREIPTFLGYQITMRANPNWICILNEAAPPSKCWW